MAMRKGFTTILLLFAAFFTFAQSEAAIDDNLGIRFHIQLAASSRELPADHQIFTDFPEAVSKHFADGYYRIYVGEFVGYHQAKEFCTGVKEKGYKNAFVSALQGDRRMTPDEALSVIYGD